MQWVHCMFNGICLFATFSEFDYTSKISMVIKSYGNKNNNNDEEGSLIQFWGVKLPDFKPSIKMLKKWFSYL